MEGFIRYIVSSLVENPSSIQIREVEGKDTTIIELSVPESDIGKVIGKGGRIAKALRVLLQAVSAKQGKNYQLEIID